MLHCRVDSPTKVTSRAYLPPWLALVPAYGGAPMVAPRILKLPTEDLFGQNVLRIFPPQGPRTHLICCSSLPKCQKRRLEPFRVTGPNAAWHEGEQGRLLNETSFLFPQSQESACASKMRWLSPWGIADDRQQFDSAYHGWNERNRSRDSQETRSAWHSCFGCGAKCGTREEGSRRNSGR